MHTTKLTKVGNSTGITIPRDVLTEARLDRGDEVTLSVRDGRIEIAKSSDDYSKAMEAGRAFSTRYRRAMAVLAK
ncbi:MULTISPECIES: AbrB/MazE/SpoVT family DNA-binding domain-containing protein [Nitrospirillum]|uniref:AbrB family transcriptional regulator n=2 Tax=Nitrospirillum TaxID=1543705 RepID=A0A248JQM3_9PROT|nr:MULTISPECIES: AbrB/MazE/SpoVT family DNA-binding domain-containing protein [Nitrospirillum]ASG20810.1 AbrB family transcriptional regulator [Nitrospirillum amazonense CBAmc]MEA1676548.1 AbrB/MazE/SpoVT family DNA-binding domain-containing protein [Nitrospirillum sp. BR 11163]MEC4592886.1 AbrB/MazE/SpoVT family DNA-binding domain-containing protein [Nitrospirillum amazonense]TWB29021.1 putative addiction module antidote [Nitrospirillum amazonense]TWB37853.1 putative addiction module antidote